LCSQGTGGKGRRDEGEVRAITTSTPHHSQTHSTHIQRNATQLHYKRRSYKVALAKEAATSHRGEHAQAMDNIVVAFQVDTFDQVDKTVAQRYHWDKGMEGSQRLCPLDAAQRLRGRTRVYTRRMRIKVHAKQGRRARQYCVKDCVPVHIKSLVVR
jgi:hypothetical protein